MDTLIVITPVTRPGHLARIGADLAQLQGTFQVRWAVNYSNNSHPDWWGGWERNQVLDDILGDSWIWFLDDDNTVHPGFANALASAAAAHPTAAGFVFAQVCRDGSPRLPAQVKPGRGEIDTGMFVFRRTAIGGVRFRPGYQADWEFYSDVVGRLNPASVVPIDVPAVYYNALAGGMCCRLCHSTDTHPLPFLLPPTCPAWVRCRACGSDTAVAAYDPGMYWPGLSEAYIRNAGGIERCREEVRSNCEWFDPHHRLGNDRSFLDVGCGDGAALDAMQARNWGVHGFDVMAPHYRGPHVTVARAFSKWLFPRRYATVLCREVLEHVESPELLLHELHGVCAPGGLVQVQTPVPLDFNHPIPYQPAHLLLVSPPRLRVMLDAAMLDIIDEQHWELGQAYLCRARA